MEELWLPVVGHEDQYLVSEHGEVYSKIRKKKMKASSANNGGYQRIGLKVGNSRQKKFSVHRLVCEAFNGPCPDGHVCCHRDDDKTNNHYSNLYWGTQKQNVQDCIRNGHAKRVTGEEHHNAKMTPDTVRAIRAATGTNRGLGRRFGCDQRTIYMIKRRITWAHVPD